MKPSQFSDEDWGVWEIEGTYVMLNVGAGGELFATYSGEPDSFDPNDAVEIDPEFADMLVGGLTQLR